MDNKDIKKNRETLCIYSKEEITAHRTAYMKINSHGSANVVIMSMELSR